jgi:hypothetical protein
LSRCFIGTTNYSYVNKDQLLNESSTRNRGFNNGFGYNGNATTYKSDTLFFNEEI